MIDNEKLIGVGGHDNDRSRNTKQETLCAAKGKYSDDASIGASSYPILTCKAKNNIFFYKIIVFKIHLPLTYGKRFNFFVLRHFS